MAISVSHGRHNDSRWIVHQFGKGLRYRYRLHRRIPGRAGGALSDPWLLREAAVLECKKRNVNTPEVKAALDSLEPHTQPK